MLVSVTGGTGFVGAHSVAAIVRAGHRVRLLVRRESTLDRALLPLSVDPAAVDVVLGDVLDPPSVARLTRGTDAVLHAASVYSFDSRQRGLIRRTNERGTEVVLAAARRCGAARIVHVSSVAALFPARGRVVGADSPVGRPRETYMASKAAADRIARRHRREGTPVVISYPPALLGPHDPKLGDQTSRVRDVLRGLMPIWPLGGLPVGDVRDTAALHAALLTVPAVAPVAPVIPGASGEASGPGGSGRYFGPGRYLTTRQFVGSLREVTGRRLPTLFLPARALVPVGLIADLARRVWPWHIPAEYGAVYACACATRVDENAPTGGIEPRPVAATMRDTVRWLHRDGHLSTRQAGALGGYPVVVV